jgi:hypothetical protein
MTCDACREEDRLDRMNDYKQTGRGNLTIKPMPPLPTAKESAKPTPLDIARLAVEMRKADMVENRGRGKSSYMFVEVAKHYFMGGYIKRAKSLLEAAEAAMGEGEDG